MKKIMIIFVILGLCLIIAATVIQTVLVYREYGVITGSIMIWHWSLILFAVGFILELLGMFVGFKWANM
jgi:hypothetical protein